MRKSQDSASVHLWERWQQVLDLSKDLFGITGKLSSKAVTPEEILLKLCQATIKNTRALANCLAEINLDSSYFSSFVEKPKVKRFIQKPFSELMEINQHEKKAICVGLDVQGRIWIATSHDAISSSTVVAFPLRVIREEKSTEPQLIGFLQVKRKQNTLLSSEDIRLITILTDQAALAFQAFQQWTVESWRQEQLLLVQQVSAQITNLLDLDSLFHKVTQLIQETFSYYLVAIFILESDLDYLRLRAHSCLQQATGCDPMDNTNIPRITVHLGQGLVGAAAATGKEIMSNNVVDDQRYWRHELLPETRSEAAIPLVIEGTILGVLDVQSNHENYFDETDMVVLRALAGNIAIAIEDARLYNNLRRRASQLSVIHEVGNAITSILDTEKLFEEVVSVIQKRFGYSIVHLFSVHPGRRKIFFEAGSSQISKTHRKDGYSYDLDDPQGLIPWVARHGKILLVNDVSQEPRYRPLKFAQVETQSEMTVPLVFGDKILGILDVQSAQLGAFGEEERFIFESLADHIAIAMRNATLYRSEAWRRRAADSLREIAGLLSADADVGHILDAVLDELEQTLPLDIAAIWLFPNKENPVQPSHSHLILAATKGDHADYLGLEIGTNFENFLQLIAHNQNDRWADMAARWVSDALGSEYVLNRSSQSDYDPLGAVLNYPLDYSAITAPLRLGDQNLGLLMLAHHTSGRYGGEAQEMSKSFASYVCVAIENARLFDSAHEQARISTALLQVAEATQSQINLNNLLNTVIQIAPMVANVHVCLLYIVDDDGNFIPAAAAGLSAEQQIKFESQLLVPEDIPALDRLVKEHKSMIIGQNPEDACLTNLFTSTNEGRNLDATDIFVLVPMLSHQELLGAFLVDYSLSEIIDSQERTLTAKFDEHLTIIQGIASQTATAVENIRLNKLQKEEAYRSVALLQAAQAIVSANDLDEALGSIVRITPILVGVKRAIIFLWDDVQQGFQISQSYGISRDTRKRFFKPGDFHLIDRVRLSNTLMAYPIDTEFQATDNVLDTWPLLSPAAPDQNDIFLEEEPCLLLGFPLGIKGKVLGVFLIEEPEPDALDRLGYESTNRSLRRKRLDIITGISQQAALAIQNDILQREMISQERLAREMQLAREIQQAFLPQSVPVIDNWDLKVFWRTAREVGGDFYDFFDLPDGRMGLVIADVADKGIPAALFMTLVRTLVRATALQVNQPDQVLERVNDLLVPDAPQGMFVTLVYAILNRENGEFEYANAGHNPPLLMHNKTGEITKFERTGMALGVLAGNRIEGRRIQIEPDDYVVMYTDGVTEAFSPNGEIFGEQRLFDLVTTTVKHIANNHVDSQLLLETINQAVSNFAGDTVISDDLTLLVLRNSPDKKELPEAGEHIRQSKEGHRMNSTGGAC